VKKSDTLDIPTKEDRGRKKKEGFSSRSIGTCPGWGGSEKTKKSIAKKGSQREPTIGTPRLIKREEKRAQAKGGKRKATGVGVPYTSH